MRALIRHRASVQLGLIGAAAMTLACCAESTPDQAQRMPLDSPPSNQTTAGENGGGSTDPRTTDHADNTSQTPARHTPTVDPRRGQVGDGTEVDLRPSAGEPTEPSATEPEEKELKPLDGALGDGQSIDLAPVEAAPSRARKRMNIDQLNAALRRVSGGIGWTSGNGWSGKSAGNDNFKTLSLTLGKPNYTDLTTEDLDPSALFQKFLGDAASSVCLKLLKRDMAEKDQTKRVLMRHVAATDTATANPGGVDDNLAYLLLRFHGLKIAPQAAQLQQWRFLFSAATKVSKSPSMGWRAVCVALVQHPRFYSY